ncbi:zinc finger, CCHC-type containing protein [Tanacetum coccineum]
MAKFKGLGETLEDKVLVRKLLNSAPKKFLPIVATIEQYQDLDEMSFEEAIGRLTAYEERIKSQDTLETNDQDKLLIASSNNKSYGKWRGGSSCIIILAKSTHPDICLQFLYLGNDDCSCSSMREFLVRIVCQNWFGSGIYSWVPHTESIPHAYLVSSLATIIGVLSYLLLLHMSKPQKKQQQQEATLTWKHIPQLQPHHNLFQCRSRGNNGFASVSMLEFEPTAVQLLKHLSKILHKEGRHRLSKNIIYSWSESWARKCDESNRICTGKQEGLKGYWKGSFAQVVRVLPYSVVQLFAYDTYKTDVTMFTNVRLGVYAISGSHKDAKEEGWDLSIGNRPKAQYDAFVAVASPRLRSTHWILLDDNKMTSIKVTTFDAMKCLILASEVESALNCRFVGYARAYHAMLLIRPWL